MANLWYKLGLHKMMQGQIDLLTDDIDVYLVDITTSVYTVNLETDEFLDDIPGASLIASFTLTGKSLVVEPTAVRFVASNVTFTSVPAAPPTVEAIVFVKDNGGDAATSPLLGYADQATGLVLSPDGGNVVLNFSASGAMRIQD